MAERIKYSSSDFDDIDNLDNEISAEELDEAFAALVAKSKERKTKSATTVTQKAGFKPQTLSADAITAATDTQMAMNRSMVEWLDILAPEVGVYNTKYGYLVKRYDEVNYKYIGRDDKDAANEAKHNLVALLRWKYFKTRNDEVEEKINDIVNFFIKNIYNNVCYATVDYKDEARDSIEFKSLPSSAVAFKNGVFDFKENKFIVKFERIKIPAIRNTMVLYPKYIIMWSFNYDFEPYPINIMDTPFDEFLKILESQTQDKSMLTWQLFSNMCHDKLNNKTERKLQHFAEILGYTICTPFVQHFVMLIGEGQNGKNSIFDGAFSHFVEPAPAAAELDNIEMDKFIGGTLKGMSHNLSFETSSGVKKTSTQIKKLTGSKEYSAEEKGKTKTTIPMNCKFVFSCNDQDNIKFEDTSNGFRRRCNLFEIYYVWDPAHSFMNKNKDYYPCDFSIDDIQRYVNNSMIFVYLGMYGIKFATKDFTRDFSFTYNEWNETYSYSNEEINDFFKNLTSDTMFRSWGDDSLLLREQQQRDAFCLETFNTATGLQSLAASQKVRNDYTFSNWRDLANQFKTYIEYTDCDSEGNEFTIRETNGTSFLESLDSEDLFVNMTFLQALFKSSRIGSNMNPIRSFNDDFKKTFGIKRLKKGCNNNSYVRVRLKGQRLEFLGDV